VAEAIERGTVDDLTRLLAGATVIQRSWLVAAIQAEQPRMIDLLLARGAPVEPKGVRPDRPDTLPEIREYERAWGSALGAAVQTGDLAIVERVLAAGAVVGGGEDAGGIGPVVAASGCYGGNVPVAITDVLLERGADVENPVAVRCAVKRPELLQVFLCHGLAPDSDVLEDPLLHVAIREGAFESVKLLLAAKASLLARAEGGDTALDVALSKRSPDPAMVELLLDAPVPAGAYDPARIWPGALRSRPVLQAVLGRRLFDVNRDLGGGRRLLHWVAERGVVAEVALVLDAGGNPALADDDGKVPSAVAEDPDVAALLRVFAAGKPARTAAEEAAAIEAASVPPPRAVVAPGETVRVEGTDGPFLLDRTEVTVAAYAECVRAGRCTAPSPRAESDPLRPLTNYDKADRADHPVNDVTFSQAEKYCAFRRKRLPTGDEWLKALRGADQARSWPWGASLPTCKRAVMAEGEAGCGQGGTWPVGSKPLGATAEGVLDLGGNVSELVQGEIPLGFAFDVTAADADMRGSWSPGDAHPTTGFRCARSLSGAKATPRRR
jgi:hypothetical protein